MAQLNITYAGQTTPHSLKGAVGKEYSIGRAEDNDISVPEASDLSSHHCRVIKTEDGYVIQDTQSTNGVTLDDRKVDYELMLPGETYKAGSLEIVLVDSEPAPAAAAPRTLKKKRSTAAPANKGAATPANKGAKSAANDLLALADKYKRNQGLSGADIAYIVIVLLAAFYAGMAFYSWQNDGSPLPLIFR